MFIRAIFLLTAMMLVTFAMSARGNNKVIYGVDDRREVFEVTNNQYIDLALKTAAMIPVDNIKIDLQEVKITGKTLSSKMNICPTERFTDQINPAMCSGFLVAPDILITAGHCVRNDSDCKKNKWVFDFNMNQKFSSELEMVVDAKNIYECKEIIKSIADFQAQNDFAIIKLDRSVEDREPLKIRTEGEIELGTTLVVIGHPSGLPTKIADSAFVRNNKNPNYFVTNLDTFAGNSGSAVFNAETFEVEGILVRGETDYIFDYTEGCRVVNTCSMDKCKGEDVTRITNLKEFLAPYVDYLKMEEVEIINTLSFKDIGLKIEDFKINEFEIEGFNTESINEIILNINITHTYSGDLVISLQHPTGKVVVLRNRTGANTDNVIQTYSMDGFEKLKAFQGLNSEGIWKLIILDNGKFDQGMLNELELIIK